MSDTLRPQSPGDVEQAVRAALARGNAIEIVGHGSKRAIGRPAQSDMTLDLSGLAGVLLYEPEELVLSVRAGTPLAEIEALVASRGQQLAFEPMDPGLLLDGPAGRGTIGGTLAVDLAGPRRFKSGAARDHLLGFTAVSGRGEVFKSGGRVVKNVTGYDLSKLMAGSWGTLAVMVDVTLKVLPRPETEATVLLSGLDDAAAARAMRAVLASNCDVSGAAHLQAATAARVPSVVASAGRAVTAFRLEGFAPSVAHRVVSLQSILTPFGTTNAIDPLLSGMLWASIRDVVPFGAKLTGAERPLWRVSTAPARSVALTRWISDRIGAEVLYDWGGGLLWVLLDPAPDAGAAIVRSAVEACEGHATLIRAPAALRAVVEVFQPRQGAVAALTKRVKESFDPQGVLNPGRMWAGV